MTEENPDFMLKFYRADNSLNSLVNVPRIYDAGIEGLDYVPGFEQLANLFILLTTPNILGNKENLDSLLLQNGVIDQDLIDGKPINRRPVVIRESSGYGLNEVGSSARDIAVGYLLLKQSEDDLNRVKEVIEANQNNVYGFYKFMGPKVPTKKIIGYSLGFTQSQPIPSRK